MKKNNNSTNRAVIAAAAAAVLLAASFLFDGYAAGIIKSMQTPGLTAIVVLFDKLFIWIYLALLAATIAVILKNKLKENSARGIFMLSASIITTIATVYLLKLIFQRERPDDVVVKTLFGLKDYAFPSAHVATAAAAAFSSPAIMRIPWMAFTAAVLFSRVYLNVHFLSDTIWGLIIAAAIGALVKNGLKEKIAAQDETELKRQVMHALIGLAVAAFVWKYHSSWYLVLAVATAGLALSYAIKSSAAVKDTIIRKMRSLAVAALRMVEREEAIQKFPGKGAIMLFLGSGITAAIFERETAIAAILILAVGDSVSHMAGRLIGRVKHKRPFIEEKMVEGTFIGFVFSAAAAATILPVWTAILAAAAGMVVEAVHIRIAGRKIDDNLSVPLVAAAVVWGLKLLGW